MKLTKTHLPALLAMLSAVLGLFFIAVGCNKTASGTPSLSVKVGSVESTSVTLELASNRIKDIAYILTEDFVVRVPEPAIVYKTGKVSQVTSGSLVIDDLEGNLDYTLFIAARTDDNEYYSDVLRLEVSTPEYVFKDLLTLMATYYDGYKVRVKVPESVLKDERHAIRFASTSYPMYIYNKIFGYPDSELLTANAQVHTVRDTTVYLNEENIIYIDKDGNYMIDETTGDYLWNHDPIVPGEPTIFIAGEFTWGESHYGWGYGYYVPMFDAEGYATKATPPLDFTYDPDEAGYWKGAYQLLSFVTKEPDALEAGVNVEFSDIKPIDATIRMTPEEGVEQYCYMILDNAAYNEVLTYLQGRQEYVQWFITSYFAATMMGIYTEYGPIEVNLKDYFYEVSEQSTYHVFVTSMGNQQGTTQRFQHYSFETEARVLPAPKVYVTPVDSGSQPFEVKFNVKAPDKNLVSAYYACNYTREWQLSINQGNSYVDIVSGNYAFTAEELRQINSDEGLDVSFPSIDGENSRLVVIGYNEELTPNVIDPRNDPEYLDGLADCSTKYQDWAPQVDSPLFEELSDVWTATATVEYSNYVDNVLVTYRYPYKSKVTLSRGLEYPDVLPEEIYDIYLNLDRNDPYTRAEVTQMYEEFKTNADLFEKARIFAQNRILIQGFIDYDYYETSRLGLKTAYDLFYDLNYNSVDVASCFYDFGPKWYLQVDADGNVTCPTNATYMQPMASWSGYVYYLCAYNKDTNRAFTVGEEGNDLVFPVEVSENRDTITIKHIEYEGNPYYPNAVGLYGQLTNMSCRILSDIVLTRGWDGIPSEPQPVTAGKPSDFSVKAVNMDGSSTEFPKKQVVKSMTKLPDTAPIAYKQVEGKVIREGDLLDAIKRYGDEKRRNIR
ncbi:MAG: hypothetical protein ACI4TM_03650 [Candidatus Cryptobacteroides sp.]